jgi:hypothetical protein
MECQSPYFRVKYRFYSIKKMMQKLGVAFDSFRDKFQVFLQIVSHCCHVHDLIGLFNLNGIDFSQPHKLCEGSKPYFGACLSYKLLGNCLP